MVTACQRCGCEEFVNDAGYYYCKACNQQTEDYIEQADLELDNYESGGGMMGVAGKRLTQQTLIVQSQKQSQSQMQSQTLGDQPEVTLAVEPPDKRDYGRPFTTFEVYQVILSKQVDELLEKGFPQSFKDRVFKLWCMYLSELGEAFTQNKNYVLRMAHVNERDATRVTQSRPEHISRRKRKEISGDEADPVETQKPLTKALINERVAHTEPSKLTMNTLLGLLYLAMCFTNPAYTIGDLRRWIRDGTLSFFNADRCLPENMKFICSDHNILTHLTFPSHTFLRRLCGNLARFLRFADKDFPPVDIQLLCVRYITELNLPGEILGLVLGLINRKIPHIQFQPHTDDKLRRSIPMYEGVAMSYIIIVLRSLYGFCNNIDFLLSQYAEGVQSYMPETSCRPFNIQMWIHYMISAQLTDLPKHNQDTQRLACLRSALHCFSTIAAPASRFTEMGNKKKTKINTDSTRKQLHNTFSQLAIKLESNKHRMNVPDNSDKFDNESIVAGSIAQSSVYTASSVTNWSEPGVTSTQQQADKDAHQNSILDIPSPFLGSHSFRTDTVSYLVKHKRFCKKYKLIADYRHETLREHVSQVIFDEADQEKVCTALMSDCVYNKLSEDMTSSSASLQLLFQICADHVSCSDDEILEVYNVIEEACISQQHSLPMSNFSKIRLYFPPAHYRNTGEN